MGDLGREPLGAGLDACDEDVWGGLFEAVRESLVPSAEEILRYNSYLTRRFSGTAPAPASNGDDGSPASRSSHPPSSACPAPPPNREAAIRLVEEFWGNGSVPLPARGPAARGRPLVLECHAKGLRAYANRLYARALLEKDKDAWEQFHNGECKGLFFVACGRVPWEQPEDIVSDFLEKKVIKAPCKFFGRTACGESPGFWRLLETAMRRFIASKIRMGPPPGFDGPVPPQDELEIGGTGGGIGIDEDETERFVKEYRGFMFCVHEALSRKGVNPAHCLAVLLAERIAWIQMGLPFYRGPEHPGAWGMMPHEVAEAMVPWDAALGQTRFRCNPPTLTLDETWTHITSQAPHYPSRQQIAEEIIEVSRPLLDQWVSRGRAEVCRRCDEDWVRRTMPRWFKKRPKHELDVEKI